MSLAWSGMDEFRAALQQLPAELTSDAGEIVENAIERASFSVRQAYPPGELRDGVQITMDRGAYGVLGRLRNASPLSHLWEFGTQERHDLAGSDRGAMFKTPGKGRPTFVPIAIRERARMTQELITLVRSAGFTVPDVG